MKDCDSKIHHFSIYAASAFFIFFCWYFLIHVGIHVYYDTYISPKETFLDDVYYTAKVDAYEVLNKRLDAKNAYTIFIGDSFIEQFPLNEFFPYAWIVNRGIGRDTTRGVLKRLERNVNNIRIARSFLMIGYNDLKYRTVPEITDNIEKILSDIKAKKKYYLSALPCLDKKYNDKIKQINEIVKKTSQGRLFEYIDCYSLFVDSDGNIRSEYYYDGVHLNLAGYQKIKEKIERFFAFKK